MKACQKVEDFQKYALSKSDTIDSLEFKEKMKAVLMKRCEEGSSNGGRTINSGKIWAQLTSSTRKKVNFNDVKDKIVSFLTEETIADEPLEKYCERKNGLSLKIMVAIILDDILLESSKNQFVNSFACSESLNRS